MSWNHFILGAGKGPKSNQANTITIQMRKQKGVLRGRGTWPKSHPLVTELGLESPVLWWSWGVCVGRGRQAVGETDVPWDMVSKPGTSKV